MPYGRKRKSYRGRRKAYGPYRRTYSRGKRTSGRRRLYRGRRRVYRRRNYRGVKSSKRFQNRVVAAVQNAQPINTLQSSSSTRITTAQSAQNAFSIDALSGITADLIFDELSATERNLKVRVQSDVITAQLVNQSNIAAYVEMYYCTCRRDVPPVEINAPTLFSTGMTDMNASAAATTYGVSPFQSPRFCSYFKINKVKRARILPGLSRVVKISSNNQWINRAWVSNTASERPIYFKGKSRVCLIIVRSQGANDSTTLTDVGTPAAALDVIFHEKIFYKYSFATVGMWNFSTSLDNAFTAQAMRFGTSVKGTVDPA